MEEIFKSGDYDINFQDGLGNTALHYAVMYESVNVLELILLEAECDVDILNRIDRNTPLHLAVKAEDQDRKEYIFRELIDAGASTRVKNKNGDTVLDLVAEDEHKIRDMIHSSGANSLIRGDDIADDYDEYEARDGSEGSSEGRE